MTTIRFLLVVLLSVGALLLDSGSAFGPRSQTRQKSPWGLSGTQSRQPVLPLAEQQCSDRNANSRRGGEFGSGLLRNLSSSSALQQAAASSDSDDATEPVRVVIAGAPASGKGTQCEAIKEAYGLVHLSTGDMLRAAVAAKTDVGKKAQEYMDSGKLVPDGVMIGVVKDRLKEEDCQSQGWLLDGFPRTPAQAEALEESGIVADCFVFLNVPDEILVERVVGRRTDPETGKIYHTTFSPPDDADVEARLVQRSDDTEEKVKVRLEQFHANVDAVRDSYTDISVTIDGDQAPGVVSDLIFAAIDTQLKKKAAAAA